MGQPWDNGHLLQGQQGRQGPCPSWEAETHSNKAYPFEVDEEEILFIETQRNQIRLEERALYQRRHMMVFALGAVFGGLVVQVILRAVS